MQFQNMENEDVCPVADEHLKRCKAVLDEDKPPLSVDGEGGHRPVQVQLGSPVTTAAGVDYKDKDPGEILRRVMHLRSLLMDSIPRRTDHRCGGHVAYQLSHAVGRPARCPLASAGMQEDFLFNPICYQTCPTSSAARMRTSRMGHTPTRA